MAVADLGQGDEGPAPSPLILGKKESQKREKPAGQAKKESPLPLAQGLVPPLNRYITEVTSPHIEVHPQPTMAK